MPTNPFGSFEDVVEQGMSTAKQAVANQATQTVKTTSSQLGISTTPAPTSSVSTGSSDTSATPPAPQEIRGSDNAQAPEDPMNETGAAKTTQDPSQTQKPHEDTPSMTPEMKQQEQEERKQKLVQTRQRLQQLHNQVYYDPTFNRRKKEMSNQERLEQEKQKDEQKKMEDIQEQKKKDEPIALNRAKRGTEMNRGASG